MLFVAAIFMAGTATAQTTANDTEEADVEVGVSSTIAVDIQPANLNYDNAEVGNRNTTSNRNFNGIEIENTGSEYINRIWLNNSVPDTDPYGSGSAIDYDAGNFLEVKPSDFDSAPSSSWYPINKKVFMSSNQQDNGDNEVQDIPSFIQVPDWTSYEIGSINRGNESIYYAIESDGGTCDGAGTASVRVGNISATDNRLGTVDFTDSSEYGWVEYSLDEANGADYGITQGTSNGFSGLDGVGLNWSYSNNVLDVDMMTKCDDANEQPHSFINKFNINTQGADDITNNNGASTQYLLTETSGTEDNMLAPGEMKTVETAINIPEGVAQGSVGSGTLRVLITADKEANTADTAGN